jgi:AcrR family transcriptional regulator
VSTTELSAETRARILEAAWQLIRDKGAAAVSVKDVASAAGVSRQLVYFHYRNRAGLLLAMTRHQDSSSGFRRRVATTRELPAVQGLEAFLREWCAYLAEILPVARALEAASITGDEGGEAWRDRMTELHEACLMAFDRVAADNRLAPGWTVASAADWAWSRVLPSTWAHLVGMRGWDPASYTERTVTSLLAELISDPPRPDPARPEPARSGPARPDPERPPQASGAMGQNGAHGL